MPGFGSGEAAGPVRSWAGGQNPWQGLCHTGDRGDWPVGWGWHRVLKGDGAAACPGKTSQPLLFPSVSLLSREICTFLLYLSVVKGRGSQVKCL